RERRICIVQLPDRLQDAKPGTDRALGIVLVRRRRSEHRHDRVSDELLDRASIALQLLPQAGVVWTDAGANVLGICRLGSCSEADEITEEDGHDLALLLDLGGLLGGQRRRAE